jgi:hypothetical protein
MVLLFILLISQSQRTIWWTMVDTSSIRSRRLYVPFRRVPERVTVLGERLSQRREALELAREWQRHARRREEARAVLAAGDAVSDTEAQVAAHVVAYPTQVFWSPKKPNVAVVSRPVNPNTPGLWVRLEPGQATSPLPLLEDVAELETEGVEKWGRFLRRYGLPIQREEWIARANPTEGTALLRVPLSDLQKIARQAALLNACAEAALRQPERLRALAETLGHAVGDLADTDLAQDGRVVVASALVEALKHVEPDVSSNGRGIPEDWSFTLSGWWPMLVLEEFVHKSRYAEPRTCAAKGCLRLLTPNRRKYCSRSCYEREKKWRFRHRREGSHRRRARAATS